MSTQPTRKPWPDDAPYGLAWKCPDCKSWATLGGNAGFHRDTFKHGEPTLDPTMVVLVSKYEAMAAAIKVLETLDIPHGGGRHSGDCEYILGKSDNECDCGWNNYCMRIDATKENVREVLGKLKE